MLSPRRDLTEILQAIVALPADWHQAGSLSPAVLAAIVRYCSKMKITQSVETGCGKSTLLFSHLSSKHLVFTKGSGDDTLAKVLASPLLNRDSVKFLEGPTQRTLAAHTIDGPVQVALLDGPHGYPFPDLEYYHIYPGLERGALLMIDDINIPTVNHLFRFVASDEMFSLLAVVGKTAFFQRSDAPTFDPLGDGWWLQNVNKTTIQFDSLVPGRSTRQYLRRFLPRPIRAAAGRIVQHLTRTLSRNSVD